jgi:hypothetical protein
MQFGIVAEGKTDQAVIELIIHGVASARTEVFVDEVQPPRGGGAHTDFGGWRMMFEWLASEKCRKALQFLDVLIVQVDTDVCDEPGFDVSRREAGRDLGSSELVAKVARRLDGLIGPELIAVYRERIVFAIAVDELECWLLPLVFDNAKASKTTGCFEAMMSELTRKGEPGLLRAKDRSKDRDRYKAVARPLAKPKQLAAACARSDSLGVFVNDLSSKTERLLDSNSPTTPTPDIPGV